jgi:ABC-2 type transport system ATP-binding protein
MEPAATESQPCSAREGRSGIALRCAGLVKRFEDVVAVDGLDLAVRAGECFGLLGPNGAGKTTTVEILEGLTPADGGTVEVLGCRWGAGHDREIRERLGVQLQETRLPEKLTVEELVRLFRSFYSRGRDVDEIVRMVGLEEKRGARFERLSGGQRNRLALACALVSDPEVLFLDEPTTGLDPQARRNLWDLVERFRANGGTVLITTHYMEEAARLCDRVAILDHGKMIALGTPRDLVASLGADRIVEFRAEGTLDRDALARLPGVSGVSEKGHDWILTVSDTAVAVPAVLAELERRGARLLTMTTHEATLDDVFVSLTGRALRDG